MSQYLINTGNILSISDITRKSGLNPAEELKEAVEITLEEHEKNKSNVQESNKITRIERPNSDLKTKMGEHSLSDLKIGLKLFLNTDSPATIQEAIAEGFSTLDVGCVDSTIITLNNHKNSVENIKRVWSALEELVKGAKVGQIGLADVDEAAFRSIHEWAAVKPTIIQVNLATCCVVPPTLQAFCKDNEVQLLTHSDPVDMLSHGEPKNNIDRLAATKWILRYLVHIKCRGVLITKGYLVRLGQTK